MAEPTSNSSTESRSLVALAPGDSSAVIRLGEARIERERRSAVFFGGEVASKRAWRVSDWTWSASSCCFLRYRCCSSSAQPQPRRQSLQSSWPPSEQFNKDTIVFYQFRQSWKLPAKAEPKKVVPRRRSTLKARASAVRPTLRRAAEHSTQLKQTTRLLSASHGSTGQRSARACARSPPFHSLVELEVGLSTIREVDL